MKLRLSDAQGQWREGENWTVKTPEGELLWEFPSGMNETRVMSAIRLGREFELEAFNIGIDYGKKQANDFANTQIQQLTGQIASLEAMNLELSKQLERHLEG